ncbi:MAG: hypothetical protein WC890_07625 [Candidatus Margulisiibacteriota bacterium]
MFKNFAILIVVLFVSTACWAVPLIPRVDFEDAAVLDVVQAIAKGAGMDVVISGDSSLIQNKRTSLHLTQIAPEEAIDYILRTNGLVSQKQGNILLISSSPANQNEIVNKGEIEPIFLKYLFADKVVSMLATTMPGLKTSPGTTANTLILQGNLNLITAAKELISSIDRPIPQILIESKVLEISSSDALRLGVTYGGSQNGVFKFVTSKDTGQTKPAEDLQTTINALISSGKAKVVATPKIATLDNQEAIINIGSRIPYAVPVSGSSATAQWSVQYIDAGVKLKITPRLGEDGWISTAIQPEVSAISEWITTAAGEFPVIATRNAQSTVRVKAGETIVIGGLLSENERENITKVPILGQIPLLGVFFQNKTVEKSQSEIVFMITPRII